jgi:hypothetical protein
MRVKRILRCISASNCTIFFSCSAGIVDFYVWWWFSGGMKWISFSCIVAGMVGAAIILPILWFFYLFLIGLLFASTS